MAVFLNDTFTDTEGTLLTAHTGETGATWTKNGTATGDAEIAANRARKSANVHTVHVCSGSPAGADYYVEAVITRITDADQVGVGVRYQSDNQGYHLRYSGTEWHIRRDPTTLCTGAVVLGTPWPETWPSGQRTARLEIVGSTLKGYVDGTLRIETTDATISAAGKPALRMCGTSTVTDATSYHFDSITAEDVGAPPPAPQILHSRPVLGGRF